MYLAFFFLTDLVGTCEFPDFVQILDSIEWGAVGGIIAAFCALIATIIALCCYMRKQVISLLLKLNGGNSFTSFQLYFQP